MCRPNKWANDKRSLLEPCKASQLILSIQTFSKREEKYAIGFGCPQSLLLTSTIMGIYINLYFLARKMLSSTLMKTDFF